MAAMIPEGLEDVLSIDPEIMHGKVCFKGTRLPLRVFLDNLEEGASIDEFVEDYPSIGRDEALAVVIWQQRETKRIAGLEPLD